MELMNSACFREFANFFIKNQNALAERRDAFPFQVIEDFVSIIHVC